MFPQDETSAGAGFAGETHDICRYFFPWDSERPDPYRPVGGQPCPQAFLDPGPPQLTLKGPEAHDVPPAGPRPVG